MTPDNEPPSLGRRIVDVVVVAVSVACFAGLYSAIVSWYRRVVEHDFLRTFMAPEMVWMSPIGHILVFLPFIVLIVVAVAVMRRLPALATATFVFGFLGALSLLLLYTPRLHQYAALVLALGLSVRLTQLVAANGVAWRRRFTRAAWAGGAIVIGSIVFMRGSMALHEKRAIAALPQAENGAPNVLLLILDTVRAQNLSLYGYNRPTTPTLNALANEGTTFSWAFSTASWTLPSHASIFTGRFPNEHAADFRSALNGDYPTLAEVLGARGYRTGGFTANLVATTTAVGVQRGFSHYEDYRLTPRQLIFSTTLGQSTSYRKAEEALLEDHWIGGAVKALLRVALDPLFTSPDSDPKSAEMIVNTFLDWRRSDDKRPYFAFLNFFDAHAPYPSPKPYQKMFVDGTLMARYDRSIRYIDDELKILVDTLRARGELDNTIVIVTADHGEQLGERGMQGHANSLYEQVVHVPLLVRYPTRVPAGKRVDRQVSLRDIAATITDLAKVQGKTGLAGNSLAAAWGDPGATSDALQELGKVPLPSPTHRNAKGPMYAIADDSLHFIRSGDGRLEIFAYRRDSTETTDLSNTPLRQLEPAFEAAHKRLLSARARAAGAQH